MQHLNKKRETRRSVYLKDRAAQAVITVGGIAVLAAVLGICLYLVAAVVPLFGPGKVFPGYAGSPNLGDHIEEVFVGEYGQAALTLDGEGTLRSFDLPTGELFFEERITPVDRTITAASRPERSGLIALGYDDGSVQLIGLGLPTSLLPESRVPQAAKTIEVGKALRTEVDGKPALVERILPAQFRFTTVSVDARAIQPLTAGSGAVAKVDVAESSVGGRSVAAVRADGTGAFSVVRTITPLGGGAPRDRLTTFAFDIQQPSPDLANVPDWLFLTGDARNIYALWKSGVLQRYAVPSVVGRGDATIALAETVTIGSGAPITAAAMLLGDQTLLTGDALGVVRGHYAARDTLAQTPDALTIVEGSSFRAGDSPVTSVAASDRDRVAVVGLEDGTLAVRHMTSRKMVVRLDKAAGAPVAMALVTPKADGLFALKKGGGYITWGLDAGHMEASIAAIFLPLRYEGEKEAQFTYQSSAGSDQAELKMSLVPLIFGTLKATIVCMLVAVPLAVLGAVYTSEFMSPRTRKVVKPTIELMASLPSVVLGFIAAMVVAPIIRDILPSLLVGIALSPVVILLAAHVWQTVPVDIATRVSRQWRLALVGVALLAGVALSSVAGPIIERTLFTPTRDDRLVAAGHFEPLDRAQWPAWVGNRATMSSDIERRLRADGLYFRAGQVVKPKSDFTGELPPPRGGLRAWLDGVHGRAWPGWVVLLYLPVTLTLWALQARRASRRGDAAAQPSRGLSAGSREFVSFLAIISVSTLFTLGLAWTLSVSGLDPRDSILGPFSQRNALVVGLIMGFAVIPIIYTISEDALRSVPNALRSASLGVGATAWQTALRVVLPAAGSGIFSAIMIGLGRAVGETMIVLMATGNSPEMSASLFSGFRTLAANIAVELPEADKGGTHYRVLFLCGLVLFALTFLINTTAEVVRQRFRKRYAAL